MLSRLVPSPRRPGLDPLIWIIDDSPTQAVFTERALGPSFRFESFTDGANVIERLASTAVLPDLLLLDWVMPGLSGDEVCRYLRQNPHTCELPVVILTASRTETADIVTALESGANDYLSKPFVAEELRARVGSILRSASLQRVAERERRRVSAMNELASALFRAGSDVGEILDVVATWLVEAVGERCELSLSSTDAAARAIVRQRDQAAGSVVVHKSLAIRDLAQLEVVLVRSAPLDDADAAAIDSCLEYSGLAVEAALRSEKERATTRMLEELFGVVAHDLRTPLSAMHLGLELLRDEVAGDAATIVARLDRSTRRMTKIVGQLLDVTRSRIGAGIPVDPQPTQLRAVVIAVLDELRAIHKDTTFVLAGTDVAGRWDEDRLEQVVSNLANNAANYGRAGGPITLTLSQDETTAYLEVHNELRGPPIPQDQLQTLFDPFERGRESDSKGLGLGLYIVQQITRAHGGTIVVDSDQTGTRFRLALPLAGPPNR